MAGGLIRRFPAAGLEPVLKLLFFRGHDTASQAEEAMRVRWPTYASRFGPGAFIRLVGLLYVHDTLAVAHQLPSLRVPARVAWGTGDPFQKIEYGERFARDLSAPLHRIEGGKHFTPKDHSEMVAQAIQELIAEAA